MESNDELIMKRFGVSTNFFFETLRYSQGSEGYLLGAIGERLFKQYAEQQGFEVLRIKEKPEGGNDAKSDDARGDFYIRKKEETEANWFVVECKSVKSNAEKHANLTNRNACLKLLEKYSVDRLKTIKSIYNNGLKKYKKAQSLWVQKHWNIAFPEFSWSKDNPGGCIPDLSSLWNKKEDIKLWLDGFDDSSFSEYAFWDLKAPLRLIQTHMPSSRTDELGIKSTGPLVTEFNILSLDLFLRTGKHKLIFVNSKDLNSQASSPNHLQQNYTVDILTAKDNFILHKLQKPWYDDLLLCIKETCPIPRQLDKSQLDHR